MVQAEHFHCSNSIPAGDQLPVQRAEAEGIGPLAAA
jgi:hypothetical protein